LDNIALYVENLQLIVVLIILTIGITSKCMLGDSTMQYATEIIRVVVVGVGKVFFKDCCLQ